MGTRGAYGYYYDGNEKVTYNHFDSYPEHLGVIMLDYARSMTPATHLDIAHDLRFVDEHGAPTLEEQEQYKHLHMDVSTGTDWYSFLRAAQGQPSYWTDGLRVMFDSRAFLLDSLFCEWAYIINLDDNVLEVYRGFNRIGEGAGRYAKRIPRGEKAKAKRLGWDPYYGVVLIAAFPLDDLPDEATFLDAVNQD